MPVRLDQAGKVTLQITPEWQETNLPEGLGISQLSGNYYWELKEVK
jgi:hypothetical protein